MCQPGEHGTCAGARRRPQRRRGVSPIPRITGRLLLIVAGTERRRFPFSLSGATRRHRQRSGTRAMARTLIRVRRLVLGCVALGGAALLLVAGFISYSAYTLPLLHAPAAEVPPAAILYASGAGAPFAA